QINGNVLTVTYAGGQTTQFTLTTPIPNGDFVHPQLDGLGGTDVVVTPTVLPTIDSIVASGSGITNGVGDLNAGHILTVTVDFSDAVIVNTAGGIPTLNLNDGGTATYAGGSGTNQLIFSYTVGAGQNAANLAVSGVNLDGAIIPADLSGADVTFNGLQIDTTAPGSTVYDVASDFEQGFTSHSNPNGVWSYGYSSGFTGPVTLYDQTAQPGVDGPNAQYWLSSSVNIGESPAAKFNDGPTRDDGNVNFLPDQFLLVSGIGGQYSDLVFTAPATGEYSLATTFRGDQYGIGTVVGVIENGNVIFSSRVSYEGQLVPFNETLSLSAGDELVFSVGPGGGLQNTGLSVSVTELAPAPTDTAVVNGFVNAAHDTATQELTGTAEAGSTVTVYDGTTQLGTTTAAPDGSW
ncbi:hypothetical protein FBZ93_101865, partial [Bradyrhizobium macuxiense]